MPKSTDAKPLELVSLNEAAEYLGVTPLTVRRMISRGDLRGYKLGSGPKAPIRVDLTGALRPIPAAGA